MTHPFISALVDSIRNEERQFDMRCFLKDPETGLDLGCGPEPGNVSCGTASCMAGHIMALAPERAIELVADGIPQDEVAETIFQEQTGQECRLDFYGMRAPDGPLSKITREPASDHILGVSDAWPQLDHSSDDDE
jgi:hypothetical protein